MSDKPFEPLLEVEAAGMAIDTLNEEQRQILSSLTPEEVDVLVKTKKRLDEATDVPGYGHNMVEVYGLYF